MSLLSSKILLELEKKLIALEPEIVHFIVNQIEFISVEILKWIESKPIFPAAQGIAVKEQGNE